MVEKKLYAQSAGTIQKLGLELGGTAPFIAFNSAKVSQAIPGFMTAKFRYCGQVILIQ